MRRSGEREREHLEELCFIKLRGDGIKNLGERKVGGRERERERERERRFSEELAALINQTMEIESQREGK